MIASQTVEPDKFISLAGPGFSMQATLRRQLADQPAYVLSMSLPILEQLEKGKTVDSVPPLINMLFRPSVQPYLISAFKYDPVIEISKVQSPVLIVQGTTDIQIQVEDAKKLAVANSFWNAGTEISVALLGFIFFGQKLSKEQIVCIVLILIGVNLL